MYNILGAVLLPITSPTVWHSYNVVAHVTVTKYVLFSTG